MIRLTFSQMRRSIPRLVASSIAVLVATAFVTATLLGGNLITDITYRSVTASYGDADVLVTPETSALGAADAEALMALPEIDHAEGSVSLFGQIEVDGLNDSGNVQPVPAHGALDPFEVIAGALPGPGEVALSESSARRLGLGPAADQSWQVGGTATLSVQFYPADGASAEDGSEDSLEEVSEDLRVSGIVADPPAINSILSPVVVDRSLAEEWAALEQSGGDAPVEYTEVVVVAAPGVGDQAAAEAASVAMGDQANVRTVHEVAQQRAADFTGDTRMLVGFVLAFAAVAMFVAGLVIANTFQVLIAQRRHTLALLRCVGATRSQIRRSVLVEALTVGVLASIGGILLGLGLGQIALAVAGTQDLGIPIPAVVSPSLATILVPLLTGTLVTVIAGLAPAKAATAVAPISALRPAEVPALRRGGSTLRLVLALLLGIPGTLMLVGAVVLSSVSDSGGIMLLSLAVGVLGGMLSLAGVLVGAVFMVPAIIRVAGGLWARLAGRSRATVRLATANSARNPRRTSATSTALLIGVGLVVMVATGAASARATLENELLSYFPVDIAVSSPGPELSNAQLTAMSEVEGIEQIATRRAVTVEVDHGSESSLFEVFEVTDDLREVIRDPAFLPDLETGTVRMDQHDAEWLGVSDGESITFRVGSAEAPAADEATEVELQVEIDTSRSFPMMVSAQDMDTMAPDVSPAHAWLRIADGANELDVVRDVQDAVAEVSGGAAPWVSGEAAERAALDQVIETLLAVIIGLLGVAVVIAVIGVANTLSLSVIERRREHALLRAVGMTRGQLRGSLVVEGVLLAVVGTGLGTVAGLVYGWAGSSIVLSGVGDMHLVVPWGYVAACAAGAVIAGVLASVLPARSAAKAKPVAALAA